MEVEIYLLAKALQYNFDIYARKLWNQMVIIQWHHSYESSVNGILYKTFKILM